MNYISWFVTQSYLCTTHTPLLFSYLKKINIVQPTTPNKSQGLDNNQHIFQIPSDSKQENETASHPAYTRQKKLGL